MEKDLIIGIDAGTSVIKAIAFDLKGNQISMASLPNAYSTSDDGAATQPLERTWDDCTKTLKALSERVKNLAKRTAAIAVTAQGDGTWLVGKDNKPVTDAWLWLDARAASTVNQLTLSPQERQRFEITGTGLSTCQQGPQLAYMLQHSPNLLDRSEVAFHCKDWLYLNLTGVRATDPSEGSFTFGNYKTRQYDDRVIEMLGLKSQRHLMPEIVDGSIITHPLSANAAAQTGLLEGTPISLGYVDFLCTGLGAGVHTNEPNAACSIIGSTGMHMRSVDVNELILNEQGTGYTLPLPIPNRVAQIQSNMAATLNLDWALNVATDLLNDMGQKINHSDLVEKIDTWLSKTQAGEILYHPYISEAGERGPFVNAKARAGFIGLNNTHRFPDLLRAVVEGLAMATRDCYGLMGSMPSELRITGGAARSKHLRSILSAAIGAPTRISHRQEAGAAGAAMMAAVAIGVYKDMDACIADWVLPQFGEMEQPNRNLSEIYDKNFQTYEKARHALEPIWDELN